MTFRWVASLVLLAGALALAGGCLLLGEGPLASPEARHLRAMKWRTTAPARVDSVGFADIVALPHVTTLAQRAALERPARFDLSSRVRAAFDEVLSKSTGALLERVSARFRMGGRTLQRRLEAEGVRFDDLLDQYRHERAVDWVRAGKLELAEISYRLGYAQPRAFFRAFRRWTGRSPGELRAAA